MYNDELTKKLAETAKRIMAGGSVEAIEEGAEKDTKGDKEAYTKFFNDTLKKYGVKSPAELKGDDEKKFYDEIDAGWKADDEKPEKNESAILGESLGDIKKKGKSLEAYAKKHGGIDKIDMLLVANMLKRGDEAGAVKYANTLDTDPRDYILNLIYAESVEEMEGDEGDVEEGLVGNLIKKGAKRFLTRKGRNDARNKKLKKLKSKASELRRSKKLKRDIKTAKKDIRKARRESTEELEEQTPDFHVKYAKSKRGPIQVTKFMTLDKAKKFLSDREAEGYRGIISKDGKPVKESEETLEEAKIDLNKKFNTSDAAFDYFHSFSVADQAKTDQEVEKSKKKFAKNTLGFWMQNLTDTLKGMGISEETELDLTEEEEDEIVASILDTIPDAEAAADDDNHPDEEDILATLDTTTGYKVVDNLPEETEKLDARRREFREKIRKLAYEKAKKMIKGIADADDEEVEGINSSLEVQKDEATGAVFVSHVKEETEELEEAKSEKYKEKITGKYDKNRVTAGYEIQKGEGVKVVSLGNFETVEDALLALKKIPSNWTDKYYTLGNQKFGERKLSESNL
jgi:hypothetical protein